MLVVHAYEGVASDSAVWMSPLSWQPSAEEEEEMVEK